SVTERNLRGRGQYLRLAADTSSQRKQVQLRFTEPRFMGREMSAGFDLYTVRTDFLTESSFINQSTGFGLRVGFPVSERAGLGLTYSLIQDHTEIAHVLVDHDLNALTPEVDQCDPVNPGRPLICDQAGTFLTSVFGF